jgi:low temperature requirement protein LtrA
MAAMLIVGLAVPGAFDDDALVFAVAYFVVRALHILVYAAATPDVGVQAAVRRLAPGMLTACGLLIGAAFLDGIAQGAVWALALLLDFGTPILTGVSGFTVSPRHFAERHGLIIIIALGESIIAIGVGTGFDLDATAIAAAALGLGVVIAKWWAYFDVVALVAERRLSEAVGDELPRMARDSYSYLHMPMVAGIVLFALGMKKSLDHIHEPLEIVPAVALTCGVSVYLLAHIAFRLRNVHSVNRQRLVVALLLPAFLPLALEEDAIWPVLAIAAVMSALVAYEVIHFREARARVRARRNSHEGEVATGR